MMEISKSQLIMAYKVMASTPEGQIVLHDLQRHFGFPRSPMFDIMKPDPYSTIFRDGQRSVCVYIGNMMDSDPDAADKEGQPIHDEVPDGDETISDEAEQFR